MIRKDIAEIAVAELASEYQTPFFVYDAAPIRRRISELKKFDGIRFAQKACSNLSILRLIKDEGCVVDCVSAFEIKRAIAAGFDSAKSVVPPIVYTADIFDRESLDLVIEHNIPVNCGSIDMISQYGTRAPGRNITVRINPGFGHGHSQKTNTGGDQSKHGIWFGLIDECIKTAKKYGLKITGLHTHIGSGTDFEHLGKICESFEQFVPKFGLDIEMISCGGGLPIPYQKDDPSIDVEKYYQLWDRTRKKLEAGLNHEIHLEIEPGRYIVAESGFLVAEIRAVKNQGENLFYLVDAGFNNLARPILYGAYHPISISTANATGEEVDVVVGGPLCESGDIFTQEEGGFVAKRKLPLAKVGDYLILEIAGAYGSVMGSNYNSKPLAAEILIDNGNAKIIRRRQTFEQLIQNEL